MQCALFYLLSAVFSLLMPILITGSKPDLEQIVSSLSTSRIMD